MKNSRFLIRVKDAGGNNIGTFAARLCLAGFTLALCTLAQTARAQSGMAESADMITLGTTNLLDTYLSPERYTGTEMRYIVQTTKEKSEKMSYTLTRQGTLQYAAPRAENANFIGGTYAFSFALHRQLNLMDNRLRIKLGGMAEVGVGFLYSTRNTNNPAQGRLYLNLSPNAISTYDFTLWGKTFTMRYEVSAPVVGLMFSPNYGQSYYEIFSQGNYDHNVAATSPLNAPCLKQMLTVDIPLKKTAIRLGYLGDIWQAKVNNLSYHTYSHALLIGFVKKFTIIK
ncbi:MAG: DUF3316 domain-containing protein [Prevotellaceae bacterium]|nr:DUF3316 domain-containing protein [Prevotella sp.]MDD7256696.1 DUF3316 domain-containing protein [Prevotellaceae bacterium]MDY6129793.1 DUF3316 domain-containing protein [Prevotella sp.]